MNDSRALPEDGQAKSALAEPVPGGEPATSTSAHFAAGRQYRRAVKRASNPLYIPPSWLLGMLLVVLTLLAVTVLGFLSLRADSSAAPSAPEIALSPAALPLPSEGDTAPATALPATAAVLLAGASPPSLALTGPPVPTVILTDTPLPLALGLAVAVVNVGNDELNVRNIPTLRESQILFRAPAGKPFHIVGGPQFADGYTWWQLQDPRFEVIGWAVSDYLQAMAEEANP